MESLKIYRIDDRYVRFLRSRDSKVQDNKDRRRPYVGVVLIVGMHKYFVPMESPKANHKNIKAGPHIFKLDNGNYGLLGFNNMIPVPDCAIRAFDIDKEPNEKYRELLKRQANIINRNKATILAHASDTYYKVTNNTNKFLVGISCDFLKLEKASKQYDPNRKPIKADRAE